MKLIPIAEGAAREHQGKPWTYDALRDTCDRLSGGELLPHALDRVTDMAIARLPGSPWTVIFEAECEVTGHPVLLYTHGNGDPVRIVNELMRPEDRSGFQPYRIIATIEGHRKVHDGPHWADSESINRHLRRTSRS